MLFSPVGLLLVAILVVVAIKLTFNVLPEYERGVIFRLGRIARGLYGGNGPGLVIIVPFIDRLVRVSLRTVAMDVPPQDVITKDNVTVKVNAVIYFRVVDQERAIIQVEDYLYATSMMSQTTLRSVLGQSQLDDLLSKREQINADLQRIIDQQTEPWGVKVTAVEVKNVDLPQEMQRAIARQAEAERERRAKVIHAEGEFEASRRLADAADVIEPEPRRTATSISPDACRNRGGEKFDYDFPHSHRYDRPLSERTDPEVAVAIEPIAL